jgi:hypothetical protein
MPLSPLRPFLAGGIVALVAVLSLVSSPTHSSAAPTHPIAIRAMEDLGTWQGECWQWMKKVVYDATGKTVGFGYRDGYLEAGAIEVSIQDAQAGDIIQIVNDDWDGPGADYNGLHTAIILEPRGDGTFDAIDSNQKWDGIVRLRPNYDPAGLARARGLDFHIYRITGEAPSVERTAVAPPDTTISKGDRASVNTPGECLRLRTQPGGEIVTCVSHGTSVVIVSEHRVALGMNWVQVQAQGVVGWMAAQYLEVSPASAAGPVSDTPVLPFRAFIPLASAD